MLPSWEQPREQLAQVLPQVSCSSRSELIQLVAVTQKTAERSYRELIEQQIQTYQRRLVTSSAFPLLLSLWELPGSQCCWSSRRDSPKPETCLKPKQSIFGFQAINPTWEGVTVGSFGLCIVWVGLWVTDEDRDALVEVWVTLCFSPISLHMQLVEGDRIHLWEKPACLSTRSEGERMGKDGLDMTEVARNIISFVVLKNSQKPSLYLMPVALCRVNTVAGTSGEQQCLLLSPAPDSAKSFNLCLRSYIFTWADASILDFQNPETFPWKGLEAWRSLIFVSVLAENYPC